ncbi:DUF11 domain-containing protein [Noviherbaspirillum sp. CPCC 100848]|uniref:DUF11 domain-containing protein n=1 Tax=Noviherbaspirillum album TaxID=3080276 RepID=A0ABU6JH33_9BURK|nr:DUF11 domain-containing protein [Noviherbaspirillum sp. CPCC 100848]MEC4722992.1 DUF11 domain-containing protein [Noviherbaspirillum sp. CPCC 100848]
MQPTFQLRKRCLLIPLWLGLSVLLWLAFLASAHADNCSPWRGPQKQAWFNEYFFGNGGSAPPNFLEVYSTHSAFPASWQGWSIDVYSSKDVKTTYPLDNSTATACTVSNKTWLTSNVPSGLRSQNGLVILKDGDGKYVDAFVFDNNQGSPPAPWPGNPSSNWFNGLSDPLNEGKGCKPLADALDAQANASRTKFKQYNMLVLGNYGNKDMARDPDGGPIWDLTSNTGAGTTYTQCVSNNTNFTKTVDNPSPTPGSTVTYTLNLANTGSSSMTGVQIIDNLPPTLTYISATSSNPADPPVVTGSYTTVNPNTTTGESLTATTVTWNPAAVAGGTVSKLYIKMQVPADATPGHSFVNTARTIGLDNNQTDFANITIGSPDTPSFAISVSPASGTTCTTSPLLGPKVTITAMSAANGGGVPLTSYNGVVTLTASTPNPKWYNANGTALAGNTVQLTNGTVTLYLLDKVEETFTVSALDVVYADPDVMQGSSGNITFTDDTSGITLTDIDALTPAYGAVAGRPHAIRATLSNCGAPSTATASYSGTIHYIPGINHPAGATGPTINTTAASCPGGVTPPLTTSGTPITLNFNSGRATFYLCSTDVGQYALKLSLNGITRSAVTGVSSNFTVRPFAITATGFANAGGANPAGTAAFARAGSTFSGTLRAWRWLGSVDAEANAAGLAPGNGVPDQNATAANIVAGNPGVTARFNGTTNNAGVVNLMPVLAPPVVTPADTTTYALGTLSPATATLASGAVTLTNAISYSEVGNFRFGGVASAGTAPNIVHYAVTNYLGAASVNVPILSDVVGRITPDHFTVTAKPMTRRLACAASAFTYMDEPFTAGFMLTARNASGQPTLNYRNSFAFLNPVPADPATASAQWKSMSVASGGTLGLGALGPDGDLSARLAVADPSASGWVNGENEIGARLTFARAANPDGPFENLALGIAPRDGDGITLNAPDLTLDGSRFPLGTTRMRFGRLNVFSNTVSGRNNLTLPVQAQFWSGRSWIVNADDDCTTIPAAAIRPGNYRDARSAATNPWPIAVGGDVKLAGGLGAIALTRPANITSGTVDLCIDLGADPAGGIACTAGTPSDLPFLKGRWAPGATFANDPSSRASFGVYTPETRRTVHVRELF